ncbi:MAG: hypothetical protein UY10_C0056G0003 [Microgenomates group bacterium GW2011_GWA2_47_8]|nr:MAG: hypothetical protein UY10_C0056G0003 [Microgenomates group bacterium GW2011_GWA2_47_8]
MLFFDRLKDRKRNLHGKFLGGKTQMRLKKLPQVQTGQNRQGRNDQVHCRTVGKIWHIRLRDNFTDDTFIAVPSGELISYNDLSNLSNFDDNFTIGPRLKFITCFFV